MKPTVSPMQDLTRSDPSPKTLLGSIQAQMEEFSKSAYLDGLVLLSWVSGLSKSRILAEPSPELTQDQKDLLQQSLLQLKNGIPLPYVLGKWEFFRLPFMLTPDVLIPRPETEGLVERALTWLRENPGKRSCLEIGTGSGCIAVALVANQPDLHITASDISGPTLGIARGNARLNGVETQIRFLEADLLEDIKEKFDLLIANLPYIPTEKLFALKVFQTEPRQALDGGSDGLSVIGELLKGAPAVLKPGARIILELDEGCGQAASELAQKLYPLSDISLEKDLSGLDRYLLIQT
jgi:release factor glutamine methyltransferase